MPLDVFAMPCTRALAAGMIRHIADRIESGEIMLGSVEFAPMDDIGNPESANDYGVSARWEYMDGRRDVIGEEAV